MEEWSLYIIKCNDGSLYTGISTDVEKRLRAHSLGKGAKYLRGRGPLEIVYCLNAGTKSEALKMESRIKKMSRKDKEILITTGREPR